MRTAILLGLFTAGTTALAADPARDGAAVYKADCARCHGARGEGSKEFPKPLIGGRSIGQLARLIAKTMPEDDPGTLSEADARSVAEYIHGAFYSELARERNRPARIELARLTVGQYRNAVADILGSFQGIGSWDSSKPGLQAQYYKNRRYRNSDRVLERVDPVVRFDWGTDAPVPEKIEPHEFSIRWDGSVLAPETGEYEFIVKTEHAARLYINDPEKPLIDAWVKSGNDTEYKATIHLLGGRPYNLKLEFSKAKQGVDDSKDKKEKPKSLPASIRLEWRVPGRPVEIIPARNLSTVRSPKVFVVATAFPADDKSVGYVKATTISKAWDQATTEAALETAAHVVARLDAFSGSKPDAQDRGEKLRSFTTRFVERAFRRPLTDEERKLFVDTQFATAKTPEIAVRRAVLFALKSPRFLYLDPSGRTPHDVAARLAAVLWDSIPDKPLLDAAAQGKLATEEQIRAQAERMLTDVRARTKVRALLLDWLRVEQPPDLSKDPKHFAEFAPEVAADLRTSLELFLDDVVWGEGSDYRRFLTDDSIYLNGRLAKFYGVDLPPDADFRRVKLEPEARAGVISHPYLLAAFAYTATSSPIHRGVFLSRSVLGRSLQQPPEAVAPLAPDLHPDLTTRKRVELQTSPAMCTTCHGMINPLGFGLEHFDAVGRYRKEEKGKAIDAKAGFENLAGESIPFDGARSLANVLLASGEPARAFVDQCFHSLVRQPIRAYGSARADLERKFTSRSMNIRELLVEVAVVAASTSSNRAALADVR
ncbi:MAG: DUF1592 domain-containing protein [Isosphaeraceae bacterium]|nr:DUF1592 domain-containing protein [Isosphaeraceae bacterium]